MPSIEGAVTVPEVTCGWHDDCCARFATHRKQPAGLPLQPTAHLRNHDIVMMYRSATQTLADLRLLIEKLEEQRNAYEPGSFAELRRILQKRIVTITRDLDSSTNPAAHITSIKRA